MKNKSGGKVSLNETTEALILILPLIILMLVFIAIPTLSNFYYSTRWNGLSKPQFIGLDNYIRMIKDARFLSSLKNMGILILYIPLGVLFPLVIAAALRKGLAGWNKFRAIYYLPNVLGPVLLGILYAMIFSQIGPLTEISSKCSAFQTRKPCTYSVNR